MDADTLEPKHISGETNYELTGKIMLTVVVILSFMVILLAFIHVYARCYLARRRRSRRIHQRNANANRNLLIFYLDSNSPSFLDSATVTRGLDQDVLKSLPLFTFSNETHPDPVECSVCLCDFEENDSGRVLPKCNHRFHLECIDMWFHSHSTCPLCRSPVELVAVTENLDDMMNRPDPGSSSGLGEQQDERLGNCTSGSGGGTKQVAAMEVHRRNDGEVESESDSDANRSFKSQLSRILSFKRILSRKSIPSVSGETVDDLDV